ncbi:MAG: tRNA pseudouridine(55) synthase TruB [Alphaproteobacteria bacterium]|nr:tRNA pseudouridine(55) synthase TruB [Alphaproteobacteria bacterium]
MTQSGWIILDKDSGLFSRTAGGRIARMLGTKKFGHIGTLDPMATGVLPIAIGDATKMIPFVEDAAPHVKEYLFSCQFGFETDTLDITGTEIVRNDFVPCESDVRAALPKFIGRISQVPPIYSAVHVSGARAYELARRGRTVEIPARDVEIFALELTDICGDTWHFRMRCSPGTYVRSVARDIAKMCGTFATVNMIRRTQTNGFDIKDAVKLDFLEKVFNNSGSFGENLKPADFGLGDIPVFNLSDKDAGFYKNGGFIETVAACGLYRVYAGDVFIGIGAVSNGLLRPKRTL